MTMFTVRIGRKLTATDWIFGLVMTIGLVAWCLAMLIGIAASLSPEK